MRTGPYRYRVDFILKSSSQLKVIGHTYVSAWSRKEAWFESWSSKEYKGARDEAVRKGQDLMFDATRLERVDEV